ncbi:unnamed protein product [Umbelopsis vinacea]
MADADIKFIRLLESTLYDLHMPMADWISKAANDKTYIIFECIKDCEAILNDVLMPSNWILNMPSVVVMMSIYSKFYPDQLYPFMKDLTRNQALGSSPTSVLSKSMDKILSVSEAHMSSVECECYNAKSAILAQEFQMHKNEYHIVESYSTASENLQDFNIFDAESTELEHIEAFVQELCLIVAVGPPSQMSKIVWVIVAAIEQLVLWSQTNKMGNVDEYIASVSLAVATKVSNLLKGLIFALPTEYGIDNVMLDPMVDVVSAFTVLMKSRPFQEYTFNDTISHFDNCIQKTWSSYRIRRGAFLATLGEDDLRVESVCNRSIYNMLQLLVNAMNKT